MRSCSRRRRSASATAASAGRRTSLCSSRLTKHSNGRRKGLRGMDPIYELEQKLIAEVEAAHVQHREVAPKARARTDAPLILERIDWDAVSISRARLDAAEI